MKVLVSSPGGDMLLKILSGGVVEHSADGGGSVLLAANVAVRFGEVQNSHANFNEAVPNHLIHRSHHRERSPVARARKFRTGGEHGLAQGGGAIFACCEVLIERGHEGCRGLVRNSP